MVSVGCGDVCLSESVISVLHLLLVTTSSASHPTYLHGALCYINQLSHEQLFYLLAILLRKSLRQRYSLFVSLIDEDQDDPNYDENGKDAEDDAHHDITTFVRHGLGI